MGSDVPIGCACGALRGVALGVSPARGNRLACYCRDCQLFAHALGGAEHILDEAGGTDIFQMSPARLEIHAGQEHLACMRLRPGGLLRWFADCCRTPIGNTPPSPAIPFVGLIHSCIASDEALGPIRGRVHAGSARGGKPPEGLPGERPALLVGLRVLPMLLAARLRGDHKRSPFFDAERGRPTATPHVLSDEELRSVEAAREAADASAAGNVSG